MVLGVGWVNQAPQMKGIVVSQRYCSLYIAWCRVERGIGYGTLWL